MSNVRKQVYFFCCVIMVQEINKPKAKQNDKQLQYQTILIVEVIK